MTRPIERLYINHEYKKGSKFAELFNGVLTQIEGNKTEIDNGYKLTIGEQTEISRISVTNEAPHFIPKNVTDRLWFPDISLQDQKYLEDINQLSDAQRFGNQLHLLLSLVHHSNEIETTVLQLIKSGEIEIDFLDRLKSEAFEILQDTDYQSLFSNHLEILSEQPIIIDAFNTIRPDKIIIKEVENETKVEVEGLIQKKAIILDYKTGMPNSKYSKQITEYVLAIKEIGYSEVEG